MISAEVIVALSEVLKLEGPRILQDPYRLKITLGARVPSQASVEVDQLCQILQHQLGQVLVVAAQARDFDVADWADRAAESFPDIPVQEWIEALHAILTPEAPPVIAVAPAVPVEVTEQPIPGATAIIQIAFSHDGSLWAVGDAGMNISLANRDGIVWTISVASPDPKVASMQRIRQLAFDPSGRVLMVALADRLLAIDVASGDEMWWHSPKRFFSFLVLGPSDILFLESDRMLVPFDDGSVSIWNLSGICEWKRRRSVGPRFISPLSGNRFVGTDGSQTFVWQMPAYEEGYRPIAERVYGIASLMTSPVVALRTLEQLHIIDIDRQETLATVDTDYGLPLVAGSPTAGLIALGFERSAKILTPNGAEIAEVAVSSGERLTGLAFSPDGGKLALGSFDGRLNFVSLVVARAEATSE